VDKWRKKKRIEMYKRGRTGEAWAGASGEGGRIVKVRKSTRKPSMGHMPHPLKSKQVGNLIGYEAAWSAGRARD